MANKDKTKKELSSLHKKFLIFGALCAAFVSIYAAYVIVKPDEIAFIPEVEARVQAAQEETLEIVDEKLLDTSDVQMQIGNKIYRDTIRGLKRELRQIIREQKPYNDDIPQYLIDSEDDIEDEIADEQADLDEIKAKIKKRLE